MWRDPESAEAKGVQTRGQSIDWLKIALKEIHLFAIKNEVEHRHVEKMLSILFVLHEVVASDGFALNHSSG